MNYLLLFVALCVPAFASATIYVGGMTPSAFGSGGVSSALYDLDNNGQYDFYVAVVGTPGTYKLKIKGMNGAMVETDGALHLMGYNSGTPLGVNSYQDSGYVQTPYYPDDATKYAGIKFKIAGQYCCGYISINAGNYISPSIHLMIFGYETNNSICITAGAQSNVGIEAVKEDDFSVFTNNTRLFVKTNVASPYNVEVFDVRGMGLYETFDLSGDVEIEVGNLPKSILLVVVSNEVSGDRRVFKVFNW